MAVGHVAEWGPAIYRSPSLAIMGVTGHKKSRQIQGPPVLQLPPLAWRETGSHRKRRPLVSVISISFGMQRDLSKETNTLPSAVAVERVRLSGWEIGSLLEVQAGREAQRD